MLRAVWRKRNTISGYTNIRMNYFGFFKKICSLKFIEPTCYLPIGWTLLDAGSFLVNIKIIMIAIKKIEQTWFGVQFIIWKFKTYVLSNLLCRKTQREVRIYFRINRGNFREKSLRFMYAPKKIWKLYKISLWDFSTDWLRIH